MDILKLISNLGSENIENLINLASNFFQNKSPPPQTHEPPPQTNFDATNPYWSLPTYSAQNENNSTTQCIVPSQNSQNTNKTNDNQSNFLKIIKVVLPLLLNKQSNTPSQQPQQQVSTQNSTSEILKLKKTK